MPIRYVAQILLWQGVKQYMVVNLGKLEIDFSFAYIGSGQT